MRRPEITSALIKEICDKISNGLKNIDACVLCGISESVFYKWKKIGEEEIERMEQYGEEEPTADKQVYVEFVESLKRARQGFKESHLNVIRDAAYSGDWKASAWMLERTFPEEYAKVDRMAVINNNEGSKTDAMQQLANKIMQAVELPDDK